MAQIYITLPIVPAAQKRARSTAVRTKSGKYRAMTYKSKSQTVQEDNLRALLYYQQPKKIIDAPIDISIIAVFPRPKSHYGTGANSEKLKGSAPEKMTTKPDVDNLAKMILDCMSGVFFHDDKQICNLSIQKCYEDKRLIDGEQITKPGWKILISY